MHILAIRFSSMGDVVLQTATLNWLKAQFGSELTISFVTSKEFASLLEGHPSVSQVISFDRRGGEKFSDLLKKIRDLHRHQKIDLILDLHSTLRSWHLRQRLFTIPQFVVDKRRWERFLLTKIHNLRLKKLLRAPFFGLGPQVSRILVDIETIFGDSKALRRTQDYRRGPHGELTSLGEFAEYSMPGPYVVLAPSASFVDKRWPVEKFRELALKLIQETSYTVVILAGPTDDFCKVFDDLAPDRVKNLQGKTSLKESMSILSRALICLGNDSGMNHIAEAYGVPCVTIFGPTDPLFGFAPHGKKSITLSKELWCKPCSTTGKRPCFRDRRYCMEMITVEEVFDAFKRVIS